MIKRLTVDKEGTTQDFVIFLEDVIRNINRGNLCGVDWDISIRYKYEEDWKRKDLAKELFKIIEPALQKKRINGSLRYQTANGYKTEEGMIAIIIETLKKV